VEVKLHQRVQFDLDEILKKYQKISPPLADDFFAEFQVALHNVARNPKLFHFDHSGLRRGNLERFPYHFLYDIRGDLIRVWVLRYNRRDPDLGTRRFPR